MLSFLHCLRRQKLQELNEVPIIIGFWFYCFSFLIVLFLARGLVMLFCFPLQLEADLRYIEEDITAVERHRLELCSWEQERSAKLRMLVPGDQHGNGIACSTQYVQDRMSYFNLQNKRADVNGQSSSKLLQLKDAYGRSEMQCVTTPGVLSLARKRRVHSQVSNLAK